MNPIPSINLCACHTKNLKACTCKINKLRKQATPLTDALKYHLRTLFLFTYSDTKTILIPSTLCGLLFALAGSTLLHSPPPALQTLFRLPTVLLWVYLNLLPFDIENQRQPDSITEDSQDKPWRPLPSGRLSPHQARNLMFFFYPAAILASVYIGGLQESLILLFLGVWYNTLGGSENYLEKNFLNACGFTAFGIGATKVALGATMVDIPFKPVAQAWFFIIAAVIMTSCQLQDLPDMAGDSLRGRRTMPLVLGDAFTRWSAAAAVVFWSWAGPAFWQLGVWGYLVAGGIGAVIVGRTLCVRERRADKVTFYVWNLWMVMFYFMPLMKRWQGV